MHHLSILIKEAQQSASVIKNGFIKHELCYAPAHHGQNHNQQISSHKANLFTFTSISALAVALRQMFPTPGLKCPCAAFQQ